MVTARGSSITSKHKPSRNVQLQTHTLKQEGPSRTGLHEHASQIIVLACHKVNRITAGSNHRTTQR